MDARRLIGVERGRDGPAREVEDPFRLGQDDAGQVGEDRDLDEPHASAGGSEPLIAAGADPTPLLGRANKSRSKESKEMSWPMLQPLRWLTMTI